MNKKTTTIGLIYDQLRPDERMIIDASKNHSINLKLYNTNQLALEVTETQDDVELADAFLQRCISYFRGVHVTAVLESRGKTVVNSYKTASICGNKLLTSIILSKAKIPTPRTFLTFTKDASLKALEQLGYPAVLKPVVGSWGRLVALVKDSDSAMAMIEAREYMHPIQQIYYLQEMVKRPERDIRCYVIGDRAVAAMYRRAPADEWRTNTARGGFAEKIPITPELEELSLSAAEAVGGGAFGVDLMETDSGLVVHEVNSTSEFKSLVAATGIDVPGLLLEYMVQRAKQ